MTAHPLATAEEHARALALLRRTDAVAIAPRLLGAELRVGSGDDVVAVRLTEVEAYAGAADPGSHAFRGRTERTAPMFAAGGLLYVYFSYGMHWCANLVCGEAGTAAAVLLRAGEVVEGAATARARREAGRRGAAAGSTTARRIPERDLARGPANLARCLGLTGADSGAPLDPAGRAALVLPDAVDAVPASRRVRTGPRVGVAGPGGDADAHPWRFWLDGEPTVSAYRPGAARRRG